MLHYACHYFPTSCIKTELAIMSLTQCAPLQYPPVQEPIMLIYRTTSSVRTPRNPSDDDFSTHPAPYMQLIHTTLNYFPDKDMRLNSYTPLYYCPLTYWSCVSANPLTTFNTRLNQFNGHHYLSLFCTPQSTQPSDYLSLAIQTLVVSLTVRLLHLLVQSYRNFTRASYTQRDSDCVYSLARQTLLVMRTSQTALHS